MAAAEFNERQGRTGGALLINATVYGAGATAGSAAEALRAAHSSGAGPSVYIGPSTDRGLHAAMPYASENGIVLVSAGSTAPSLAAGGDTVFRLLPSDRLEAEALARLAHSGGGGSVHTVLDNATYGPLLGGSLDDAALPPPQGGFFHAFGAALAFAAISPLSSTVTLAGGDGGGPYDAGAAAAALDASVRSASAGGSPASVVYLGSPEGLAALAERSALHPALSSASWFASSLSAGSPLLAGEGPAARFAAGAGLAAPLWSPPGTDAGRRIDSRLPGMGPNERNGAYAAYDAVLVVGAAAASASGGRGGGTTDTAAIADGLPEAAADHTGALGDIALDYAGDLWVPAKYDLWTVAQPGGRWRRRRRRVGAAAGRARRGARMLDHPDARKDRLRANRLWADVQAPSPDDSEHGPAAVRAGGPVGDALARRLAWRMRAGRPAVAAGRTLRDTHRARRPVLGPCRERHDARPRARGGQPGARMVQAQPGGVRGPAAGADHAVRYVRGQVQLIPANPSMWTLHKRSWAGYLVAQSPFLRLRTPLPQASTAVFCNKVSCAVCIKQDAGRASHAIARGQAWPDRACRQGGEGGRQAARGRAQGRPRRRQKRRSGRGGRKAARGRAG